MNERPSRDAFNDRTLRYYDWFLELACNRVWQCSMALERSFRQMQIDVIGCVAQFSCRA